MGSSNAARAEFLLNQLKDLSEKFSERMRMPPNFAHRDQSKKYDIDAERILESEPKSAANSIAKFTVYRAKFVKDGSKPIDFRDLISGTVAVVTAAIKASKIQTDDSLKVDFGNQTRVRSERDIYADARVVDNEANNAGTIGESASNGLNVAIANGARVGVVAGEFTLGAMKDVVDDERIKATHRSPMDNLRTMKPEWA